MQIPWHDPIRDQKELPISQAPLPIRAGVVGRVGLLLLSCGTGAWRVRSSMNEIAEALGLAQKAGLDMARLLEALSGGAASSPVLSLKGGRMISGDYTPSSRVLIHLKDQRNAQELTRALGAAIPACDLSTALLGQLADMGRGGEDVAAVIDLFA